MKSLICCTAILICVTLNVNAEQVVSKAKKASGKERPVWQQYCDQSLRQYKLSQSNVTSPTKIKTKENTKTELPLAKQALFVHMDDIGASERGLLYSWNDKHGRPAAVITSILMKHSDSWNELHEYFSFSDKPIQLSLNGSVKWTPKKGPQWRELPNAPRPASRPTRLQLQAKLLARRFKVKSKYDDKKDWDLRLISRPLSTFSYQDDDKRLYGGALLTFCRATDPEVLLMIEVRKNRNETPTWHFCVGLFTAGDARVLLDDQIVWRSNDKGALDPHGAHYAVEKFDLNERFRTIKAD